MAIVFIGVVLIFLLASFYIASRICRSMKMRSRRARRIVWAVVILLDASFFLSRLIGGDVVWLHRILYVVSTTWLPVVLYMTLIIGVMSAGRIMIRRITGDDPYRTPLTIRVGALVTVAIVVIGYVAAVSTEQTRYDIYTSKLPQGEKLRIALASDLHTGYAVTRSDVDRLVADVNSTGADLVVIAGDLIDGDLLPVRTEETLAPLSELKARIGVFAVMGNHEYMDDDAEAERLLRSIPGIRLLRDETRDIEGLHIIGRDDISHARAYDSPRRDIAAMTGPDSLFTIVIDHQPGALSEANAIGADLTLSGHTHAGQLWPMNIVTGLMYDIDYGYGCYGSMSAIVTSGFGTWGPRMRIGTQSEIVVIDVIGTGATKQEGEAI